MPEPTTAEQIKSKIIELEEALLSQHPTMPVLLQTIHKQLKENPDVVTLLAPEEVAVIVNGLKHQTRTEIVTAAIKSPSKKSIKSMTLDDL